MSPGFVNRVDLAVERSVVISVSKAFRLMGNSQKPRMGKLRAGGGGRIISSVHS